VLAGRVLVLGLGDQALTGIVVGLSLTTTAVLGLVATVVRAVLNELGERLQASQQFALQKSPLRSILHDS
jgi:hypothetical protein